MEPTRSEGASGGGTALIGGASSCAEVSMKSLMNEETDLPPRSGMEGLRETEGAATAEIEG